MFPNKWRFAVFCALFALVLCCLFVPSALAEEADDESDVADTSLAPVVYTENVYVKNDSWLMSAPEAAAMPLRTLLSGSVVQLTGLDGDWARISADGLTGYAKKTDLSYRNPVDMYAVYTTEPMYLHLSDKASSKIMGQVSVGQRVELVAVQGNWARVKINNQVGFMLSKGLSQYPPGAGSAVPSKQGDTGDSVKQIQLRLRELGYLHGAVDGVYQGETRQAVMRFQRAVLLEETGEADRNTVVTMFLSNAPQSHMILSGNAYPASGPVIEANWWTSGISDIFARQTKAVVTDVRTGISFHVWRGGGTNHADVQPVTSEDTALMKQAFGGSWSWARRPIWVSVGGKRYAASMNGMPHGQGSIRDNNFDGHFCIHFSMSRTHATNRVCPEHQARIREALAAGNNNTRLVSLSAKAPDAQP